jgi:type II secretory pathway component PulF
MPSPYNATLHGMADWRQRSLLRANLVVLLSLLTAFWLSNFPHNRESFWIAIPLVAALAGTVDTCRCMRTRWSWYHGGVVLCAYMDLMAICMIVFFLVYPLWL